MKLPRSTFTIVFEAPHEYAGLEVVLSRRLPLGLLFEMQASASDLEPETVERFADAALVSWNLEDDDGPVPATAAGMMRQDYALLMTLVNKWTEVVTQPGAPLDGGSANGKPSPGPPARTGRSSRNRRN